MSILFSSIHLSRLQLTLVVLQGYPVFTRNNPIWSIVGDDWGFEVVPWVMIGIVLLFFLGWLLYDSRNRGEMDLRFTPLGSVDLRNGIAPFEDDDYKPRNWLMRCCIWILNKI
jgi:hypothetical protein